MILSNPNETIYLYKEHHNQAAYELLARFWQEQLFPTLAKKLFSYHQTWETFDLYSDGYEFFWQGVLYFNYQKLNGANFPGWIYYYVLNRLKNLLRKKYTSKAKVWNNTYYYDQFKTELLSCFADECDFLATQTAVDQTNLQTAFCNHLFKTYKNEKFLMLFFLKMEGYSLKQLTPFFADNEKQLRGFWNYHFQIVKKAAQKWKQND